MQEVSEGLALKLFQFGFGGSFPGAHRDSRCSTSWADIDDSRPPTLTFFVLFMI